MDTGIMTDKQCLASIKKYLPEAQEQCKNILHDAKIPLDTLSAAVHRWVPWAIERIEKLEEAMKFGVIKVDGKTYYLTQEPSIYNAKFDEPYENYNNAVAGDRYDTEIQAEALDENGTLHMVWWIVSKIRERDDKQNSEIAYAVEI